jgi:hypothetical protein
VAELGEVQNLVASWWFDYDRGAFDVFGDYFTADARFTCRSDSGATAFEEFVTADVSGHDALVAWQVEHRRSSPYPLRHNGTNVHLVSPDEFRSYLFVTQIVGGGVSNLSRGTCTGRVHAEGGRVRFAELHVVLDFTDSEVFSARSC